MLRMNTMRGLTLTGVTPSTHLSLRISLLPPLFVWSLLALQPQQCLPSDHCVKPLHRPLVISLAPPFLFCGDAMFSKQHEDKIMLKSFYFGVDLSLPDGRHLGCSGELLNRPVVVLGGQGLQGAPAVRVQLNDLHEEGAGQWGL